MSVQQVDELERLLEFVTEPSDTQHSSKSLKPNFTSAPALMAKQFPPTIWVLYNIIAMGLTVLAGAPKLGKSWFMLNVALAIALGGIALGKLKVDIGSVLYLALEDNDRRLQSRLTIALNGELPPEKLTFATVVNPLGAGGEADILGWISATPDARLIVIDTMAKIRGPVPGNQNLYASDYEAIGRLKRIADQYNIAIVVVHHTRKAGADDPLDMVSGTQGIAGAADTILVLKKEVGRADANLYVRGRDVPESDHALSFDPVSCAWTLMGDAATFKLSQERQEVVELLTNSAEPMRPKQIAEVLGKEGGATRTLLSRMAKEGTVDALGAGLYRMPATSQQRVLGEDDWEAFE